MNIDGEIIKVSVSEFEWLQKLFDSKFNKPLLKRIISKKQEGYGGVLSDYEKFLGYNSSSGKVRSFLMQLIELNILKENGHKNKFIIYIVDFKKLRNVYKRTNLHLMSINFAHNQNMVLKLEN